MSERAIYEQFTARFEPLRRDDLRNNATEWIGRELRWERAWLITEEDGGAYVGDYACVVQRPYPVPEPPFVWVPECDLVKT